MATNNPVGVVRNITSSPSNSDLVHMIVGRVFSGASAMFNVETKLSSILSVIVVDEVSGSGIPATISDSATYPGSKVVSFTTAGNKYSYIIVGFYGGRVATVDTITSDTTVVYEPVTGR